MDRQSNHRTTVAQYFSSKTNFWTVVYSQEGGACNDYLGHHMRRRQAIVLDCLERQQKQSGNILDVGCGSGSLMLSLSERGHRVSGVDISPGMVDKARERLQQRGLNGDCVQQGGIESLPYESDSFEVVTCVGVMEYVCDEQEALAELLRVLKPGGRIILTTPNLYKLQYLLDPYYGFALVKKIVMRSQGNNMTADPDAGMSQISTNENYTNKRYSLREMQKLLAASLLVPVEWTGVGYGPFTLLKRKIFSDKLSIKLNDRLEIFFSRFFHRVGRCFANRWVICLKRKEI